MKQRRRPVAYAVSQRGLREYTEYTETKKDAIQAARECLWWSQQVTITPLYAGKPLQWISKKEARRRSGVASK